MLNQSLKGQTLINWDWQNVTEVSYNDIEFKNNFIYAVGNFTSPSVTIGSNTYVNAGGSDIIICKMDTLGNSIWSVHIGGSNSELLKSICVDNNENVLVTGTMEGTLNVGSTTLNSIGGTDMLMIKFDSSGNVVFAKNVGTIGNDNGLDITTDYNNDVYAVGDKSADNLYFASTNNTYRNAILKWSSGGTELYMHYMREGLTGLPATASATLIKYSEYDSTIIIAGGLYTGSTLFNFYSICHSSNTNLYTTTTASFSWGAVSGFYLCKTNLSGIAQKLTEYNTSYLSWIYDLSTNPVNGDFYFSSRVHYPLSQSDYNYWTKCDASFTNFTGLPINLSSNAVPQVGGAGAPLKINYFNNSLYGLLYQSNLNSNVVCTDYYAAKLNLTTGVSELKNLDYGQTYTSGIGFNGTFCMGSTNTIGKSSQANFGVPAYGLNQAPDVSCCSNQGVSMGFPECYYVKGGTPPYTYSWMPATGLNATNIPQPWIFGSTLNSTYTLTVTDSGGNVVYDTINVVVNPAPVITYSYAPTHFCAGDTVVVSFSGGSYYYPNPYSPGNYLSNPLILTPTQDTSFHVLGYNNFGCWGMTQVSLNVNPLPTPIITWSGNDLITQPYYTSYQWLLNNTPITGANDSFYFPSSWGYYFVEVSDSNGCVNTSSILNFYPLNTTTTTTKSIQVFPNPAHAFFTINFPTNDSYRLMLTDMSGKKVFEKITDGHSVSETISIAHLAEGVYNLKVIGDQVYNMKIIRY